MKTLKTYKIIKKELNNGRVRYGLYVDGNIVRSSKGLDVLFELISQAESASENELELIHYVD